MSLLPYVALAEVGPEDADFQSFLDIASKVNVVNDTVKQGDSDTGYTIKEYVERYVWEVVTRAKQRRMGLEQEWLAIQRMATLQHDEGQKYKGRSNAYLPVYARNRKTLVSQYSKGLFPSDEFMDVENEEGGDGEEAACAKALVKHEMKASGLRRTIKAFLGQFVDFGISCIKGIYRTERIVKGKKGTVIDPVGLDIQYDEGFQVSTRSMFNVVVYPEWAESKRELQLEAERMEVPISYVQAMRDEKRWLNVEEALSTRYGGEDEFDWVNTSTLADVADIPNTLELRGTDNSPVESVIIVECWTRIRLPPSQYAPGEDPRRPVPVRIVFVNGVAVLVRRNPFYHQTSPFQYARDNNIVGSFYADGAGRMTRDTQYLANDFINQMNDCGIYGMNPIALVNTNYFSGDMGSFRPGRTYKVRDVEKAIKFHSPDVNNMQWGGQMVDRMIQYGQEGSGAPATIQGTKSASTATGTQILQHNAQSPLQDTVEDIEEDVMIPLMNMCWELSRQYRSKPFVTSIGGQAVSFTPANIAAKLRFTFLSSSQSVNRQARQQGVMVFTDLAGKLGPNLQAQGLMLNPVPVLQKVWSDGLGFRDFGKVVVPIPGMPAMPGAGGPPGVPGPASAPPGPAGVPPDGGAPPSTVPQGDVPGAQNNEPVPGEGEAAGDIMGQVQQDNALAGVNNAPGGLGGDLPPY